MAFLYADENFPLPVVVGLRVLHHDVVTVHEEGLGNRRLPDDSILIIASQQGRAVLTTNRRDFVRLHLSSSQHAGIIVCTFDPDFLGQAHRIDDAIRLVMPLTGKLVRVNRIATAGSSSGAGS